MRAYRDILLLVVLAVLFLGIAIPRIRYPELEHGDDWADTAVLNAADNFSTFGFLKFRFLPLEELQPQIKVKAIYTHYPPLAQLFYGLLRVLFKPASLIFYRWVALTFSLFTLLFWYLFVKRFSGRRWVAFLAAVFYLCNPFFIFGIDSFTQVNSSDTVRSLILFVFAGMLVSPPRRKAVFVGGLWVLLVIESLITFEYIVYFSLFFVLYRCFFKEARNIFSYKDIAIFWSAPVFGFLLHFLQNAWYFGGLGRAFDDLRAIGIERVVASKDSPIALSVVNWLQFVLARNFSQVFIFSHFAVLSCVIFSVFLYFNVPVQKREVLRRMFLLCVVLSVCGISWYVLFPSHTLAHTFVMFQVHHLVPVASLSFAFFVLLLFAFIKEHGGRIFLKTLALSAVAVIIAITGVLKSGLPVTREAVGSARDFLVFKKCLLSIKPDIGQDDLIASNLYRHFFMGYYLRRTCLPVFDTSMFKDLQRLPRYFIFLPHTAPATIELFGALQEKYVPLFQCASGRYPLLFLKLKE